MLIWFSAFVQLGYMINMDQFNHHTCQIQEICQRVHNVYLVCYQSRNRNLQAFRAYPTLSVMIRSITNGDYDSVMSCL